MSFDKRDFVGPLTKPKLMTHLKGIAKGLTIAGEGHVLWAMHDTKGMLRLVKVPAFYVPKCRARLLSTTSLLQTYPGEKVDLEVDKATLSGMPSIHGRGSVVARVDPTNNLPTSLAYRYDDTVDAAEALMSAITTVDAKNRNLTEPEKELLKWHNRLGHLGFKKIQFLMKTGVLAQSRSKRKELASKLALFPKCAACQFGKQCRRPSPGKKSSVVRDKEGALKRARSPSAWTVHVGRSFRLQHQREIVLWIWQGKGIRHVRWRMHLCQSCLWLHPCYLSISSQQS